nr:hypothetical protein [Tanacetum cinerariifolium]
MGLTLYLVIERGNIACHKSEARFGTLLREGRLASQDFRDETFWRNQVNFGPPNPTTNEKALWYGVKGSVRSGGRPPESKGELLRLSPRDTIRYLNGLKESESLKLPAFRDEAFWRSQVNFGPPNPATDEKALWYGVKGSVYVVTLPAFQRCLEGGPDATERRPGSGFPIGRGAGDGHLKAHHDLQATPARPGKATRLGVRGSIVPRGRARHSRATTRERIPHRQGGAGDGHLKAYHDLQATPARPGKETRLGVRGSIIPAASRTSYSSFLKAGGRDLFFATKKNAADLNRHNLTIHPIPMIYA